MAGAHELWLAWWKSSGLASPPVASDTPLWGIWQFWQYSSTTSVPGISGNVDGDVYYGTQTQLDALRLGYDGALAGDFNRDGKVDSRDYIVWRNTKGLTVPIYSGADANGDAKVDNSDLTLWRSHFNMGSGGGSSAGGELAGAGVPEPSALGLAITAICSAFLLARGRRRFFFRPLAIVSALVLAAIGGGTAQAQVSSVSAWDASEFRIWGFVPYWVSSSTLNSFPADGVYTHVSDVLYFGGVRPKIDGGLYYTSTGLSHLAALKTQAAANGFQLHMSMFTVHDPASDNDWDVVWKSIIADPNKRQTFVNEVTTLLQNYNMKGFNFDYERPATDAEWGNYTQLARELGNTIHPLGMEVSVCDYGGVDGDWDNSPLFDARVYDQLFIMGYHYSASLNSSFANQHTGLTAQGSSKAFKDSQIAIGVGTWGAGVDPDGTGPLPAPSTYTLKNIVAAHPSLAYDALTVVEGSDTWNIESRKQVREKTQLALDRGMPGTFTWTLHYDATNNFGLHRVMHHYAMVKRDIPDLNLDGKVNATDATLMANNQGTARTNTGLATAAQFDAFYLGANWENGDRDGNGFVNQADADWLAGRYTALGVTLPDRLAYSGTFESFSNATGSYRSLAGRSRCAKQTDRNRQFQAGGDQLLVVERHGRGGEQTEQCVRDDPQSEWRRVIGGRQHAAAHDAGRPIHEHRPRARPGYVRNVSGAREHFVAIGRAVGVAESQAVAGLSEQLGRDRIRLRVPWIAAAVFD